MRDAQLANWNPAAMNAMYVARVAAAVLCTRVIYDR